MKTFEGLKVALRTLVDPIRDLCWGGALNLEMLKIDEQDVYLKKIKAIHRLLRVPDDYHVRGLSLHREPEVLVAASCGVGGQIRRMTPVTLDRFTEMALAAKEDGVNIGVKWAFRSVDDQARLIRARLRWGESITDVLTWVAAPGYSEHHSGRALDIAALSEVGPFEDTDAFRWLSRNAKKFEFEMSYPVGNRKGIVYEPWHWFCHGFQTA